MKNIHFQEQFRDKNKQINTINNNEKVLKKEFSLRDRINEKLAQEANKNINRFTQVTHVPPGKPIKIADKPNLQIISKYQTKTSSASIERSSKIKTNLKSSSKEKTSKQFNNKIFSNLSVTHETKKEMNLPENNKNLKNSDKTNHRNKSDSRNKTQSLKNEFNDRSSLSTDKKNNYLVLPVNRKNYDSILNSLNSKFTINANENTYDSLIPNQKMKSKNRIIIGVNTEEKIQMKRKNSFRIENKNSSLKFMNEALSSLESNHHRQNISATMIGGNECTLRNNREENPFSINKLFSFANSKQTSTLHNIYSSYSKKLSDYLIKNKDNILLFGTSKYVNKKAKDYLEDKFHSKHKNLFESDPPNIEFEEKVINKEPRLTFNPKKEETEVYYKINETRGGKVELTPLPAKARRIAKNIKENSEFYNCERSAVAMRRFEYTHKFKTHTLKITKETIVKPSISIKNAVLKIQSAWRRYLYHYFLPRVIYIQKNIRGFLIRIKIRFIILLFKQVKYMLEMLERLIEMKRKKYSFNRLCAIIKKKIKFNSLLRKLELVQRNIIVFLYRLKAKRALLLDIERINWKKKPQFKVRCLDKISNITKRNTVNYINRWRVIIRALNNFIKLKQNMKINSKRRLIGVNSITKVILSNPVKKIIINQIVFFIKSYKNMYMCYKKELIKNKMIAYKYRSLIKKSLRRKYFINHYCFITKKIVNNSWLIKKVFLLQDLIRRHLKIKKQKKSEKAFELLQSNNSSNYYTLIKLNLGLIVKIQNAWRSFLSRKTMVKNKSAGKYNKIEHRILIKDYFSMSKEYKKVIKKKIEFKDKDQPSITKIIKNSKFNNLQRKIKTFILKCKLVKNCVLPLINSVMITKEIFAKEILDVKKNNNYFELPLIRKLGYKPIELTKLNKQRKIRFNEKAQLIQKYIKSLKNKGNELDREKDKNYFKRPILTSNYISKKNCCNKLFYIANKIKKIVKRFIIIKKKFLIINKKFSINCISFMKKVIKQLFCSKKIIRLQNVFRNYNSKKKNFLSNNLFVRRKFTIFSNCLLIKIIKEQICDRYFTKIHNEFKKFILNKRIKQSCIIPHINSICIHKNYKECFINKTILKIQKFLKQIWFFNKKDSSINKIIINKNCQFIPSLNAIYINKKQKEYIITKSIIKIQKFVKRKLYLIKIKISSVPTIIKKLNIYPISINKKNKESIVSKTIVKFQKLLKEKIFSQKLIKKQIRMKLFLHPEYIKKIMKESFIIKNINKIRKLYLRKAFSKENIIKKPFMNILFSKSISITKIHKDSLITKSICKIKQLLRNCFFKVNNNYKKTIIGNFNILPVSITKIHKEFFIMKRIIKIQQLLKRYYMTILNENYKINKKHLLSKINIPTISITKINKECYILKSILKIKKLFKKNSFNNEKKKTIRREYEIYNQRLDILITNKRNLLENFFQKPLILQDNFRMKFFKSIKLNKKVLKIQENWKKYKQKTQILHKRTPPLRFLSLNKKIKHSFNKINFSANLIQAKFIELKLKLRKQQLLKSIFLNLAKYNSDIIYSLFKIWKNMKKVILNKKLVLTLKEKSFSKLIDFYFYHWKFFKKINLIPNLKSKRSLDNLIIAKSVRCKKNMIKQIHQINYLSLIKIKKLFKIWEKKTYLCKLENAISMIKSNFFRFKLKKKLIVKDKLIIQDIATRYSKKMFMRFFGEDKDNAISHIKYKTQYFKFTKAIINKESYRFVLCLRRSYNLKMTLSNLVKVNEGKNYIRLRNCFFKWRLNSNSNLSYTSNHGLFFKRLSKSQSHFFINNLKMNAVKFIKLNDIISSRNLKITFSHSINKWLWYKSKMLDLDSLAKCINKITTLREISNKFNEIKDSCKMRKNYIKFIESLKVIPQAIKKGSFDIFIKCIYRSISLNSLYNISDSLIIESSIKRLVRNSCFEKTHYNIHCLDTTSKKTDLSKSQSSNLLFLTPIIKGLVDHLLVKRKKDFFERMKKKRDTMQNYKDFSDFFVNYIIYKVKINLFNGMLEMNIRHFAKNLLKKVYFNRVLIHRIVLCLRQSRNLIRLNDILCIVEGKIRDKLNHFFFKRLFESIISKIKPKGREIILSLLQDDSKYNNSEPANSNRAFKLCFKDSKGHYIRNIYSNGWFNKHKDVVSLNYSREKIFRMAYHYFLSMLLKISKDINCNSCMSITNEEIFCKDCSRNTWKERDLKDFKGYEIQILQSKNIHTYEEELEIQKNISDGCYNSREKQFNNLTPCSTNQEKFFPESNRISKYRISKIDKSPDSAQVILDNIFTKIGNKKKNEKLITEGSQDRLLTDSSKLFKNSDMEVKNISENLYTSNKVTPKISSALKSINKNSNQNQMINLRDDRKDSIKIFNLYM